MAKQQPEFIEQEIDAKFVHTTFCNIREGTRFFVRIPSQLWSNRIKHEFIMRCGEEEWIMPNESEIHAGILPRRHKSRPIERMINYARSSEGFRLDDAKALLKLLAEDFHVHVGWYPEGWMMSEKAYLRIELWAFHDRVHVGRFQKDGLEPHAFISHRPSKAA